MPMTADAKRALSNTIRGLRGRLLTDLHGATESAWRLSVRARDAGLDRPAQTIRARFDAWLDEQVRAQARAQGEVGSKGKGRRTREDFRREVEKQAAYTLLNRLVLLRLMEAPSPAGAPLRAPAVVTGGWNSPAYKQFRDSARAIVRAEGDDSEGYAFLLRLVFEDLATELPGLYGPAGIAELVPVPAATLRHVIDALDNDDLRSCWTDDMTLGWVYQYWNDPAREALDAKLNSGGKVEPHEIASKTQMFTERYMVDWLLQNSLGPMWLAMCQKHGWIPEVQADGTLDRLEARRVEWREKRAAGEVELTDLMPLHGDAERRWAYYVPQPIPQDAVDEAPTSVRDLTIIDPAVGSGHFLVVALDLLVALYREEARHRGRASDGEWGDAAIVERILSHNLHGIDLDPRAVQIAAAALWLAARQIAPAARPERMNLVAANLRLASLPDDDPALVELRVEVERETGIPGKLTDAIVHALRGADHLGSLLKVDAAVERAIDRHEAVIGRAEPQQGGLFDGFAEQQVRLALGRDEAKKTVLEKLEGFLAKRTGADDLGLRLRGRQLAAGVRFVRMVREGQYDLVVANPPYQGTSKMADSTYVEKTYKLGKADLYAAFLLRGLELVREGGVSAMLTMRNWMFIKQYAGLRAHILGNYDVRGLGDFAVGAFDEVPNDILSVVVSVVHRSTERAEPSIALQPTPPDDVSYDRERTRRKRAATRCQEGRQEFEPAALSVVPEWPLVYWWDSRSLAEYTRHGLLGDATYTTAGAQTSPKERFLRRPWEVSGSRITLYRASVSAPAPVLGDIEFVPYLDGANGACWHEPVTQVLDWNKSGTELKQWHLFKTGTVSKRVAGEAWYFKAGVAANSMGATFNGRIHRWQSITGTMGTTSYPTKTLSIGRLLLLLNSARAHDVLTSLNPTMHFNVGDVNRLPLFPVEGEERCLEVLESAFTIHESHREPSVEFRRPGPSPWRHAQDWAQLAVDRPEGAPLPEYTEVLDPEPPTDHLSFALGVALGRFGADGEGILDPDTADLSHALPHGILFLDRTLADTHFADGLGHAAAAPLHAAWESHGPQIETKRGLRDWLALDVFKDIHRQMYEGRPIHWPLSSASKTFVAWVNIHRMTAQTLPILLADHLVPRLASLDGELNDLRAARDGADQRAARAAEKRYTRLAKARDELQAFVDDIQQCADRGAPPTSAKCPPREQDARYAPDLDDGVMINSAALWPLLDPQWKDPRKWWGQLANAKGRKDYDWSHLAMRYWPTRVDAKCQDDPSLGVAHGCFWRYHPARAWAWELRLQDEIGPDFRIEEAPYTPGGRDLDDPGSGAHREAFLRDHADEAIEIVEKEAVRRMGRGKKRTQVAELRLIESGLWGAHPAALWDIELRLTEKQEAAFHIRAPDEPAARAAFLAEHPEKAQDRDDLMRRLSPLTLDQLGATEGQA